jgi:hypothetical protein
MNWTYGLIFINHNVNRSELRAVWAALLILSQKIVEAPKQCRVVQRAGRALSDTGLGQWVWAPPASTAFCLANDQQLRSHYCSDQDLRRSLIQGGESYSKGWRPHCPAHAWPGQSPLPGRPFPCACEQPVHGAVGPAHATNFFSEKLFPPLNLVLASKVVEGC